MAQQVHVERALFIIGNPNTGKSVQLRSMFLDWRLGQRGIIPTSNRLRSTYSLSNERWLYLRLTSPHETNETLEKFLRKCAHVMQRNGNLARRWNFAGALQAAATQNTLSSAEIIDAFAKRFSAERTRAVILSPNWRGNALQATTIQKLVADLRAAQVTDIQTVDATTRKGNGLMYMDFFDFT
ncbi:MAG: hypothetical protein HKM94_03205 [Halobacteria archaeon]|nr:hypothetical protein [Halobacteria archaeon]